MTVCGYSGGDSLQCKVNRDILFKLLWQKPSMKNSREIVHSAASSFPSHISRKLMLEEHKLELQLEQIEKERKQFLNKNSNEKHMLQLSVRAAKTTARRNSNQYLVMNDNVRCHSTDQKHLTEGDDIYRKSWRSTNGVFYPCGAKNMKQLQVNKVYLTQKRAERNRTRGSLPWKRNFDMPQVPPPSRSPSQTNIIWVRVRKKSGDMNGFLKTKQSCHEITPGKKTDKDTSKKEDRGQGKGRASLEDCVLRADKNTTFSESSYHEGIRQVKRLDSSFCQNDKQSPEEHEFGWTCEEAPDVTSLQHEVVKKQLALTVKGLKVLPNEIRQYRLLKEKSEEKLKNEQQQDEDEFKNTQRNDSQTSYAKTTKGNKSKQNGRKSRESGKNSQKVVRIKPDIQEVSVFAKTFSITSGSIGKGRTEKKTTRQESKKCLSKPHSATSLKAKKSFGTKLPRKSCSAWAVKIPSYDDSLQAKRGHFRSTSDTTAGNKSHGTGVLNIAVSDGCSQGKKCQSPVPIVLPSQSQLQNFDELAKNNLRKALAIKLRRHCYTGTWAFPAAKIRKNETE